MIELNNYRDPWLADGVDKYIGFYTREYFCLDNFSAYSIDYRGKIYPTSEHAYQSMKFASTSPEIAEKIRCARSPHGAKQIADNNRDLIDPNWNNIKLEIMEEILRAKLSQFEYIQEKLLSTLDYPICEDSPVDSFWGIGSNRDGHNHLGKIWEKLRKELRNSK